MNFLITRLPDRFHRFARYVVSGGTATVIHYAILVTLVELGRVNETLSTAIGYFSSAVVHYLILYYWVFSSGVHHGRTTGRYVAVVLVSLLINTLIFWLFFEVFGIWYLFAQVITTCLVLAVTYTANSRFTFAPK
jgi:putative flippase GtrA